MWYYSLGWSPDATKIGENPETQVFSFLFMVAMGWTALSSHLPPRASETAIKFCLKWFCQICCHCSEFCLGQGQNHGWDSRSCGPEAFGTCLRKHLDNSKMQRSPRIMEARGKYSVVLGAWKSRIPTAHNGKVGAQEFSGGNDSVRNSTRGPLCFMLAKSWIHSFF